jgi:hypothetical protein
VTEILKWNAEFYDAFERLSIDMMDNVWKHDENVICVHPGWDLLVGWLAIRESWVTIFQNTEVIKFNITNTKVRIFDNGDVGVVVCQENIESPVNGQQDMIGVIATNIFERYGNRWLLIHQKPSCQSGVIDIYRLFFAFRKLVVNSFASITTKIQRT